MRASASGGEGVVTESGAVELVQYERFHGFGCEPLGQGRVGDARADFLVDGEAQGLEQRRLADEHKIMGAREVLTEQAQFAQAIGGHEMGVVDDGNEHFASAIDAEGLLHQHTTEPQK